MKTVSIPLINGSLLKAFSVYSRFYVRWRFHSIRILKGGLPPSVSSTPLVIYLNHASWWDPLVCLHLARRFFGDHSSFAPIDERSLQRYRFFQHLGFYGIEQKSISGTMKFLRTTSEILRSNGNMVWLTPQGRFVDVRQRPLHFEGGLDALALRMKEVTFLPLAIEYPFWTEKRPEILISFGQPILGDILNRHQGKAFFAKALEETQEALAAKSCLRDPADWFLLDKGQAVFGVIDDCWQWIQARARGKTFTHGHKAEEGT